MIGSTNRKKCLTFGGDPLPDTESRSLSISINVAESGILGDWLYRCRPPFTKVGEMTDADLIDTRILIILEIPI